MNIFESLFICGGKIIKQQLIVGCFIGGGLMIAIKVGTLDEMLKAISEQVDDYISAVQRDDITVEFRCKEPQFAELINLLNQKYAVHQ